MTLPPALAPSLAQEEDLPQIRELDRMILLPSLAVHQAPGSLGDEVEAVATVSTYLQTVSLRPGQNFSAHKLSYWLLLLA